MRILHYYAGIVPSDEERSAASVARGERHQYYFRDENVFLRAPYTESTCQAIVTDNADVMAAYAAIGIGVYDPEGSSIAKPAKAKPAPKVEAVVEPEAPADPEPEAKPETTESDDAPITLESTDDELAALLNPLSAEDRNAWFELQGDDALSGYIVNRMGREKKKWKTQQMGNMIEKHLGLES